MTINRLSVKTLVASLTLSFTMLLDPLNAQFSGVAPDLIIVNAGIHTMDESHPTSSAVAVLGNRIAATGSTDTIRALTGPKTRIIDASGKVIFPGFNDAHVHFLSGGFSLSIVDLRNSKSSEEFARRLGEYASKQPRGRWILGGEWDHERWPGAPLPTKEMIDAVTPDNPVFINRLDGHMALGNSLALKLGGVNKETKDPPGGVVVRDA